jgi:protein SCO1/2
MTMNETRRSRILRSLAIAAALVLSACSRPAEEPPLQGARMGGPFALVDQDGKTVRDTDFAGHYRLIYFGYTFCPDVCPTDLQTVGRALSAFEKEAPDRASRIQPIFISVDPQRDTPAVLKAFVANFHPRLIGLTGTPQQLQQIEKAYGISASTQEDAGDKNYLVDHTRLTTLYGPDGQPIAFIPADEGVEATTKALEKWVR